MTNTSLSTREKVEKSMVRRRAAEKRFRTYGMASVLFGLLCLVGLFGDIINKGASAFRQTVIQTEILIDADFLGINKKADDQEIRNADFEGLIKQHFKAMVQPQGRGERRQLYSMISAGAAWQLQEAVIADPSLLGKKLSVNLIADDDVDQWFKHDRGTELHNNRMSETQVNGLSSGLIRTC